MGTQTVTSEEVLAGLRLRRHTLVDGYMRAIVPSYERHQERLRDMRDAGDRVMTVVLDALAARRPITHEDLEFARSYLRRGLLRGATDVELVQAARMWQRVLWDAMEELAGPGNGALVAELSRPLLDYVDVISDFVTESVEDIQAALRLTQREGRREVMEALLAGRPAGPQALAAGLDDDARVVVLTAREVGHLSDPAALSVAAVTLARAPGDAVEPLFAVCGEEIVMVRATAEDPARLVELLTAARKRLAAEGIHLAVGVSAVHDGLAQIPAAYDEACMARGQATGAGGLLALAVLGPLDYLFLRGGDDTAWALVDPTIRTFVEQDLSQAGLLIHTLMAYVDCSLNVKLAAERLFVHPNTAHYRLSKIEEITGRDLRNLVELQDLVIAVRLARHLAAR